MEEVTFPAALGGDGSTITDDADPSTGLANGGHRLRFVPALAQTVVMAQTATDKAAAALDAQAAAEDAAQQASDDRDSIQLDYQQLDQLVQDADASATAAADSATTATNMADAVAQATATYTSVSAGLADTVDTDYFRVITAPNATQVAVYRNDAGSATLITTYYTQGGVDERNAQATRLARSLQRLGDDGQTLHSDFAYNAYGLGSRLSGGVDTALGGEELWAVERASPVRVWQPSGPNGEMTMTEVAPDTIARHWDPVTGEPLGMLTSEAWTNLIPWSETDSSNWPVSNNAANWAGTPTVMRGITLDRFTAGSPAFDDISASSTKATWRVMFYDGGQDAANDLVIRGEIVGDTITARYIDFDYTAKTFSISAETGVESWEALALGGGLYQVTLTIDNPAITNVTSLRTAIHGDNKWLGGLVVKEGGPVADYIKTEATAVTRAADDVYRLMQSEFNHRKFTAFLEFERPSRTSFVFALSGAGFLQIAYDSSSGYQLRRDGGNVTGYIADASDNVRAAIVYDEGEGRAAIYINGQGIEQLVSPIDLSGAVAYLGYRGFSSPAGTHINSSFSSCEIYQAALPAAELQD